MALRKRCLRQAQGGKALGQQRVKVHPVAKSRAAQRFVIVQKAGLVKPHVSRQRAKDVCVGFGVAQRGNGGAVQQHIGVAVRRVNVPVLQLRGGGQDVIGVISRVGLKLLEHHREQVIPLETAHHMAGLRRHRHRVAVVDDQGFDLRAKGVGGGRQQIIANRAHVQRARHVVWKAAQQLGPLQRCLVDVEQARTAEQHTASAMPPGANQRGQARHRACCIAATAHALHAIVEPDGGGLPVHQTFAIVARQTFNLRGGYTAHGGSTFRCPLQRPRPQFGPADGVPGKVVVVQPVMRDELVHQGQRQGCVGAGQQGDVFVAFFGGFRIPGINAHQPRACALGLLHIAPKMQVAANRVAAPDDDEFGFGKKLHAHADLAAQRLGKAFPASRRANRAVQP